MDDQSETILETLEKASQDTQQDRYVLRLYVTGATTRSIRAIANLRRICDEHLAGQYDLEVIDLYQQPQLAEGAQIVAVPTLIKHLPMPLRRIIGDMSDTARVLVGLDVRPVSGGQTSQVTISGADSGD